MMYFLYPSCRPHQIAAAIQRLRAKAEAAIILVGCNGPKNLCFDAAEAHCDLMLWFGEKFFHPSYSTVMSKLVRAMACRYEPEDQDLITYWSDDFYPQHGFPYELHKAREQYPSKHFIQVQDGVLNGERAATIPFVTWEWLKKHMGGLFWPPVYKYVVDVEPYRKAKLTGDFLYLPSCYIQHKNHFAGTRARDHVDEHNLIRDNQDWSLIDERTKAGFPVDWNSKEIDETLPYQIWDDSFYFVEM